ncbi:MAG: UDP-2,3-diacylglucosamine diphosphatase [Cytophagales bacterium]
MKNHYKTIVISDVHLGTSGSKTKELVRFLKINSCDLLILNGDIIDGWQLKKSGVWKRRHTRFFQRILKMIEEHDTEVIYLRGNHDDFLDQVLPMKIGKLSIVRDFIYESNGKKYFVVHGDIFDSITTNMKWLSYLGDIGYTFLLWLNKQYNYYRTKKGLPYYSLSQQIKLKVKSAVNFISEYEDKLSLLAKEKNCDGVICGHIHHPEIKEMNGVQYLNSGDWVESLSALVEDYDGEWSLAYYNETKKIKPIYDLNYQKPKHTSSIDEHNKL